MKLNKREKILILVLALILVSFLLYSYVIKPQRESLETLKGDRSVKLRQLSELKEEIASESKLYIELLSLEDEINSKAEGYFTKITQEDIILLIEEITNTAKLKVPDIDFPESRVEEVFLPEPVVEGATSDTAVPAEGEAPAPAEGEEPPPPPADGEEEKPKVDLKVHSADLKYEGYYYSFLDFLKGISEYEKKIIVKDIKVTKDEDGYIRGNILLDFYSIENIIQDGEELYAWGPNLGYVVGDPFLQFGDYTAKKNADKGSGSKNDGQNKPTSGKNDSNSDIFATILDKIDSIGKDEPTSESEETVNRGKSALDFEKLDSMFFVGNNKDMKGSLTLDKKKKTEGNSSLNFKYDFLEKRQHNIANISFNNNALIKQQPESLSISVNPLEQSEAAIGVIIRDREGVDYKLELASSLDWNGWQTIGVDLPIDINYPAIVERIYIETEDFYEKLTGNVLLDDMRLIYAND